MLTRCAKAYSSPCSQTVSLSPAISSQFILECALQPKIAKINKNPLYRKFKHNQNISTCPHTLSLKLETKLGPIKCMFNAENFICSLSMSI